MIVRRQADEITCWHVAFFSVGKYRWARFVPGRFKHVAAFGYSHACRTWVIYDVTLSGTRIYVLPDGPDGKAILADWLVGVTVLRPKNMKSTTVPWFGFYCVPAVRHLTGAPVRCATPTGLYRGLVAEGAEVITDGSRIGTSDNATGC